MNFKQQKYFIDKRCFSFFSDFFQLIKQNKTKHSKAWFYVYVY